MTVMIIAVILMGLCTFITSFMMCLEDKHPDSQVYGVLAILTTLPLITTCVTLGGYNIGPLNILSYIICSLLGTVFLIHAALHFSEDNRLYGVMSLLYSLSMFYVDMALAIG